MGECLRVATQHDGHVTKIAIDADSFRGRYQEVRGGSAFLLGAVLGIRADVNDFFGIAQLVDNLVALVEQVVQIAQDGAQVLARGDCAPAADGVEADGDRAFGQKRRRFVGLHLIGMIDSEHHKRGSVRGALAVGASASARGKLVRAEDLLRPEVPRAQTIDAGEEAGHLLGCDGRQPAGRGTITGLQCLIERRADVAAQRVVARQGLVGALEDDDVLLPLQRRQ